MTACDVCKKVVDELKSMKDSYRTKDVKMICDDCDKKITKKIRFYMFDLSTRLTKRYIQRIMK